MGLIYISAVIGLAMANGYWVVQGVAPRLRPGEWLCGGVVVGMASLAWMAFLFSWLCGLNRWSIGLTGAAQVLWFGWGRWRGGPGRRRKLTWSRSNLIWWGGWSLFFLWLFGRIWQVGERGAIETAPATNYGDLAFHASLITSLAYGENLPPENPIFFGIPLTYPFLIDLLTAFFLRCGVGWREALVVGNLPLGLALVGLVEQLTNRWGGGKRLAGRLAPVVLILSGGLGWLRFGEDLAAWWRSREGSAGGLFWFLSHLPATYTIDNELLVGGQSVALRYGNLVTTLLVPQRSLLFGLPLVALIVLLWWVVLVEPTAKRGEDWRTMGLAGVLAGMLPLLHAHGFFALMLASLPMMVLYRRRVWIGFLVPAGMLALPQALWLSQTQVRDSLFQIHLGWEAGATSPLLFWMVNNGIFLVVLIATLASLSWKRREGSAPGEARFYWPFAAWFIVPNLVLLAPWAWDNIKVLVYWALVSSVVVAMGLAKLIEGGSLFGRTWGRWVGGVLMFLLILAGGIDVVRGLSPAEKVVLFTAADQAVAERIRATTPPQARILHAPTHNSPVALSGRRSLMGYAGHLWSHGIDYQERERDLDEMLSGSEEGAQLFAKYQLEYLLIGPDELSRPVPACVTCFSSRYPLVFEVAGSRLFHLR